MKARGVRATRAAARAARRPRETKARGAWATRATERRAARAQGESARCAGDKSGSAGNGAAAALMQERGVLQGSAPVRRCSSLGFDVREEDRRQEGEAAIQRFARLCSLLTL